MKFQYLGTAAAEGLPAMFCQCEICRRSLQAGGRNLRTRSQAVIDDSLLLDFPPDTCVHVMQRQIPLHKIHSCLITHNHSDHLYAPDLEMRGEGFAHLEDGAPFLLYGTTPAGREIQDAINRFHLDRQNRVFFRPVTPYVTFSLEGYAVTPLKANHDPACSPVFYLISDGEKCILYANDTGWFPEETWEYLAEYRPHLDFVSLDCTGALQKGWWNGHMCLETNEKVMDRLRELGCADGTTAACIHHFSHNGGATYDDLVTPAREKGFLVAYDSMVVEV